MTVFSARTNAQAFGSISGVVVDSTGAAVIGAEVTVSGVPYRVITNENGSFHLSGLPIGTVATFSARRLGFTPETGATIVADPRSTIDTVRIQMKRIAAFLPPVSVRRSRSRYTGRLAGYYERLEKKNAGYFIPRNQIDQENSRTLSQLLLHAPGVTGFRGRAGLQGVRLRGRNCWPLVWIDGTPMPAGEIDLDSFAPQTLHGIELYLGSTTAPARFQLPRTANSCGTIVLWSRGPDTDPIRVSPQARRDLKQMLATLAVYTADKVDSQARLADSTFGVVYPPGLYAERVNGSVIVEFVVDAEGKVEEGTLGIVASSNPLFSEAVVRAVEGALFTPARLKGVSVRQLILQPFSFDVGPARTGG
ncbi:MAG: TonB family protein [Gemmatimonadaceae bacterium]|nr:TonB family protein [Gemmatimonadaceae bacterium]